MADDPNAPNNDGVSGFLGGVADGVASTVDSAAGAAGGLLVSTLAPLINAIQVWINGIQSGFAHAADVLINNVWYGFLALSGAGLMLVGFLVLWGSTPSAGSLAKVVELAAAVAV